MLRRFALCASMFITLQVLPRGVQGQPCDAAGVGAAAYSFGAAPLRCYYGFSDPLTWPQAQTACQGIGGYLAVIDSTDENALARSASPPADNPWIGFNDINVEAGTDPFAFVNVFGGPLIFNGFGAGEPSGPLFGEEDCVHFVGSDWNDLDCTAPSSYQNGFVCEVELTCGEVDCDDGNPCTADSCDPVTGCEHDPQLASNCKAAQSSLLILKQSGGVGDKQLFKWGKGDSLTQDDLDDPTGTTEYAVCVFNGPTNELLESFSVPAADGNWSPIGTKGYKYKDSTGGNGGLTKLLLKGSTTPGKSKVLVKGRGDNLPDPTLANLPLPVTVQVINRDTNVCVEAVFDTGDVKKNTSTQFKAKAQTP